MTLDAAVSRSKLTWIRQAAHGLVRQSRAVACEAIRARRILVSLVAVECRQKYAGSLLGVLWYPLYSILLLGCYCFIYLVVFRMKYAQFSTYEYVLFIFSGMVPYLGFSEAVTSSVPSVRLNIRLLNNSVFPMSLVPVKHVLAAFVPFTCSLLVLTIMIAPTSHIGWHLLYLPIPLVCLLSLSLASAWTVSAIAVVVPDIAQVINIALLLFMFVSPIGFSFEMVPAQARVLVYLNPLAYLIESFRYALLGVRFVPLWTDAVFVLVATCAVGITAGLFKQLAPVFLDFE